MTDRELLELAALAAGIPIQEDTDGTIQNRLIFSVPYECQGMMTAVEWNPLKNPADALRLAVALRIDVTFNEEEVFAFGIGEGESESINVDNPIAATCRAITRAAAEIGKEMKP